MLAQLLLGPERRRLRPVEQRVIQLDVLDRLARARGELLDVLRERDGSRVACVEPIAERDAELDASQIGLPELDGGVVSLRTVGHRGEREGGQIGEHQAAAERQGADSVAIEARAEAARAQFVGVDPLPLEPQSAGLDAHGHRSVLLHGIPEPGEGGLKRGGMLSGSQWIRGDPPERTPQAGQGPLD